jgi:hypothetical protein
MLCGNTEVDSHYSRGSLRAGIDLVSAEFWAFMILGMSLFEGARDTMKERYQGMGFGEMLGVLLVSTIANIPYFLIGAWVVWIIQRYVL